MLYHYATSSWTLQRDTSRAWPWGMQCCVRVREWYRVCLEGPVFAGGVWGGQSEKGRCLCACELAVTYTWMCLGNMSVRACACIYARFDYVLMHHACCVRACVFVICLRRSVPLHLWTFLESLFLIENLYTVNMFFILLHTPVHVFKLMSYVCFWKHVSEGMYTYACAFFSYANQTEKAFYR